MTSGQDVVLINAVVTKLNSQLPDATIVANQIEQQCDSRTIILNYTVSNLNSTNDLQAGTPIAIYISGQLVGQGLTQNTIPINGSEMGQLTITIPASIPNDFDFTLVVDDSGTGQGIVAELSEVNNSFVQPISLWINPVVNPLETLISCNQGLTKGTFNFYNYSQLVLANNADTFVGFYESALDAQNETNPILNTSNYVALTTPKEIFAKVKNQHCDAITSFLLTTKNCPPTVYNYISANNDGLNDTFHIEGLRDVFLNFTIEIYNRWGRLIWTGSNATAEWDGYATIGFRFDQTNTPLGTYYYLLDLHDVDYPQPLIGWLYFTK